LQIDPSVLIWVGGALVLVMLMRALIGSSNRARFRDFTGNFLQSRDIQGGVNQNYSAAASSTATPPKPEPTSLRGDDRIGWVIAIIGVLIAGLGIYLDHFAEH
jgi:hypothetical protein